jgi:hypothetical protein
MAYVSTQDKVPKGPHWAILTFETMHIEGDERSRTNPGHGYPAHTKEYVAYQAFTDETEWKNAVARLATPKFGRPDPFVAMHVVPATVTTSVNVAVTTP